MCTATSFEMSRSGNHGHVHLRGERAPHEGDAVSLFEEDEVETAQEVRWSRHVAGEETRLSVEEVCEHVFLKSKKTAQA